MKQNIQILLKDAANGKITKAYSIPLLLCGPNWGKIEIS